MDTMEEVDIEDDINKRRALRADQRSLQESMVDACQVSGSANVELVRAFRDKNNQLFSSRALTAREQFIDTQNIKLYSRLVSAEGARLGDAWRKYDFGSMCRALRQNFEDEAEQFSWSSLGRDVGKVFLGVQPFNCMMGPIGKEEVIKVPTKRQKKEAPDGPMVSPDMITQDQTADVQEATNERIVNVHKLIHGKDEEVELGLLAMMVDPEDNVQTVENFFDLAFLIKDKLASVYMDSKEGSDSSLLPQVKEGEYDDNAVRQQMILSMGMNDIHMVSKLTQEAAMLDMMLEGKSLSAARAGKRKRSACALHRDDDLYTCVDAHQQADLLLRRQSKLKEKQNK